MIQDISTKYGHKDNLTRGLSPCEVSTSLGFVANEVAARCQRSGGSSPTKWRLVVSLFLMLVVGVCDVKAQDLPFTPTTDTNGNAIIDESEKKYYLIQSYTNTGYYMRPNAASQDLTSEVRVNTLNIITDDMKWYFLPVTGEDGFYYICDKDDQYMYFPKASGSMTDRTWMQLKALDLEDTDHYKFSIAWNNNTNSYNIVPKGNESSYCLNKQGRNAAGYNSNGKHGDIQISDGYDDESSCWNFIAEADFEWTLLPECFQVSTNETIHYYRIQNKKFPEYYIKPGENYVGTSNITAEEELNNMVWYFKEAGSNGFMKYYYIIHAASGKYLHYRSDQPGKTQATDLVVHTGTETDDEENRFKFIVVRGANDGESIDNNLGITFNIVPKLFENIFTNSAYRYYCLSSTSTKGSDLNTANLRSDHTGHWNFVTANYTNVWADPVVTCDLEGNITITNGEEADGAEFYYTMNSSTTLPATPIATETETNFKYSSSSKPSAGTGFTTIKVRTMADGKGISNVVTKTIVYNPTITYTASSYTYTGLVQTPISIVKVGETQIASTEYEVTYKKNNATASFKDAGDYSVELTDVDGGDYIVIGSSSVSIDKATLTATAENKSVTYGDDIPAFTATYNGLVNGETNPGFTTPPTFACDYSATNDVSTSPYSITISGGEAPNYIITSYTPGSLTINPREVGLTWSETTSFPYDGSAHAPTATVTGTVNEDVIGVTVSGSETNAGNYTATALALTGEKAGNYSLPETKTKEFTIAQIALTVTANPKTITYGDVPVNDGVTYSGFVNSENENSKGVLSGTLGYTYDYNQYDDAGNTYTITPNGLTATNYAITFTPGILTVSPKEVGLAWSDTPMVYNGSAQAPTATATGTVNNDVIGVTVSGAETNVGDYTATASALTGDKAGNYKLPEFKTQSFSIAKANIIPTVSIDGWIYGETASTPSVDGNIESGTITYTYKAAGDDTYTETVPTNAGDYTIKASVASTTNYQAGEATAAFTISPKSLGDGNIPADGIAIVLNSSGELSAVKDGDTSLTDNIDYTYLTETDGNDKIVIVSGIGNYKDSAKGLYATPVFKDPNSSGVAAAVYNAKRDITSPSGITPYIVRKVNPTIGTLTISPIGYIPEDVPVLLLSDTEVEGFTASLKDSSTPVITDTEKSSNLLMIAPEGGVDVKDTEAYIFYRGEFVLTKKGTIKENNFFIYNPYYHANLEQNAQSGNAPCMTLHIVIDNSTGIDEIMVDANKGTRDDSWFTLDGRRLSNKPTQKGLYISNNRKVFIK